MARFLYHPVGLCLTIYCRLFRTRDNQHQLSLSEPRDGVVIMRFRDSHISKSISCKSTRMKEIKQRLVEVS